MTTTVAMQVTYPIEGIDISEYQDYNANGQLIGINFNKAKSTRTNLKFIIAKAGEGTWNGYPASTYQSQISEAQQAGFDTGAYHFHHMELTPKDQANYFAKRTLGNYRGNMPRSIDFEDEDQAIFKHPTTALTASDISARMSTALLMAGNMRDTLDAVSQIDGIAAIGYTGSWYCDWFLYVAHIGGMDLSWIQKYKWWMASYTSPLLYLPYGFTINDIYIWQHLSTVPVEQQVNGFPYPSRLDMNYWVKSANEYDKVCGRTGIVIPDPGNSGSGTGNPLTPEYLQSEIEFINKRLDNIDKTLQQKYTNYIPLILKP